MPGGLITGATLFSTAGEGGAEGGFCQGGSSEGFGWDVGGAVEGGFSINGGFGVGAGAIAVRGSLPAIRCALSIASRGWDGSGRMISGSGFLSTV